ncbi:hypothetical protein LTR10_021602 [Elasticomyces elasticus]|uniref:BTB domain-containing protein n=1 Tax=Exophiala sideris TaxID=1016849 RepID=A0ABR0J8F1_9EURO|nr:hypothetical protein LTR10_021602 [Elasticomyces elasticus]KAK5029859.1 hypothetical protein LTS07_005583 [Exophiala sideris]KAK5031702.1 hypothetical protein LTR13_007692 [Exophiala sideris]KAK5058380.1 hypothetical protein LTR69_006785 [Exophiala sideris]KAK5180309.1 hypothetical protein LTR44_007435 [Eurotiomycetes sp. CCFEE 6388]
MALVQQDFNPQPDTELVPSPVTSDSAERQTDIQEEVSGSENDYEPRSFTAGPIVTVIVGSKRKIYTLHRSLLLKSPFFAGCLTSGMREQQDNEIVLPEDQCRGFDFVADWIYNEPVRDITRGETQDFHSAILAYVLADKYCMPALQNALIDKLAEYMLHSYFNPDSILLLAKLGVEAGPLHDLMIAQFAYDLVNYPSTYYPRPVDRHSDSGNSEDDVLSDLDDGDTRPGWLEALEQVLTHPGLSTKLLRKVAKTKKLRENPAEYPEKHHVAIDLVLGNSRGQKRKADELNIASNGGREELSNVDI